MNSYSDIPKFLYKYLPPKDYVINNGEFFSLRFSPVSALNDPFELIPNDVSFDNTYLEKGYKNNSIDFFKSQYENRGVRILSLSKIGTSTLMWSHYAQNHSGIVLKLKTDNFSKWCCFNKSPLSQVNYSSKRVSICNKNFRIAVKNCILTKSDVWSYEEEFRSYTVQQCLTKTNQDQDCLDGVFKISPVFIDSVYLGYNCIGDFKDKVINLCKRENIRFQFMTINNSTFELDITDNELVSRLGFSRILFHKNVI